MTAATEVRLSLAVTFAENRAALEAFAAAAEVAGDRRWWKAVNALDARPGRRAIDDAQLIAAAFELRARAPALSHSRVCWLIAESHAEARGMTGGHARAYAAATVASVARRLGGKIDGKLEAIDSSRVDRS